MITNSLHATLKNETKLQHSQIESTPLLSKIINSNISLEEYQLLLRKFYGYIAPCENLIKKMPWQYLLSQREKTQILITDLLTLGIEKHSVEYCHYLPPLKNYEQVLGYMYVMEGSTLGGQVISKILQDTLKLTPELGAGFFYGYGKNTRNRWIEFCQILDNKIDDEQQNEIVMSASQTYSTLQDWMLNEQIFKE